MENQKAQVVLVILDGWGILPGWGGNPISLGNPGLISYLWQNYPHLVLEAFSLIENPYGSVGSSEVGYASIGSGRMTQEPVSSITNFIATGEFFKNRALLGAIQNSNGRVHLIGLLSDSGVHAHIDHLDALVKLAAQSHAKQVFIHAILDGIDIPPRSGYHLLDQVVAITKRHGIGRIASLVGRSLAMDTHERQDQASQALGAIVKGKGAHINNWQQSLINYYQAGLLDPQVPPSVLVENGKPIATTGASDAAILFNVRFDLTRLVSAELAKIPGLNFVSFVNQLVNEPVSVAFPINSLPNTLTQILNQHNITQSRITESLKRYHLQYFFQGTMAPSQSQFDEIIESDSIDDYSQKPELKTKEITDVLLKRLHQNVQFIVAAYPSADVLGHSGDMDALTRGVAFLMDQLERVYQEVIRRKATLVVTADHGNAEQVLPHRFDWYGRRHTKNPVPFILVRYDNKIDLYHSAVQLETDILSQVARPQASLADIAPTILDLFGIAKPVQMTGKSLLDKLK